MREAERVRSRDPRRAAAMLLEASVAHMMTGDLDALLATAERARALSASAEPVVELLATAVVGEGYIAKGEVGQGTALLRATEPYLMEADPLGIVEIVGTAAHAAVWIEDFDGAGRLLSRVLGAARAASAVTALIHPLAVHAHLDLRRGRWGAALACASESAELAEATGQRALLPFALAALTLVEASMGHEASCRAHAARGLDLVAGDGIAVHLHAGSGCSSWVWADPGGDRGAGGRRAADGAARDGLRDGPAAAGSRRGLRARGPPRRGRGRAAPAGGRAGASRWAAAAAARCRGLLAADGDVRAAFDAALALHAGLPMPFERARTELALGERLRRARQRAEAREPLTAALDAFERLGARPWAERARAELRATGGRAGGRRAPAAAEQLTPHELQIALLVAQGMTNREAAAALFLSPKTIEYHLGQIYRKLDVRGRAQLARLMAMELPEGERDPAVLAEALS